MTALRYADRLEITQVLALFTHAFDNADVVDLPLVFTPDAVIELRRTGRSVVGIQAIAAFAQSLRGHAPDHHTLDTVLLPDGPGRVRARSRYIALLPDGAVHNGDFLDVLVLTARGWRIEHRTAVPRYPLGEPLVPLPEGYITPWLPVHEGRADARAEL
ncbi:nuclear transport factor 2 family protein [Actinocorallia sp. API 0066]|uniref:nuclear transport factor 2 family protein n=1 Tax=Actinocorallia sp. API 0066 TaxID=2896846 RepID=UPI001E2D8A48|nr:nuclear transport factor 2 family protein [Actinocorallia sp. API 0066]MCD0449833.1 nuclear transport factor 2 family protein [Actinocorallia sp. API 0066]